MNLVRTGLIFGTAVWAVATATFVPFGHFVFGPDNPIPVGVSASAIVAATFAGLFFFATRALGKSGAANFERGSLLAVFTCLPGLVFDGSLYALNSGRYPGLDQAASGAMAAGLLLAYAAALIGILSAAARITPSRGAVE